jgi:serine/threonine protein kinase
MYQPIVELPRRLPKTVKPRKKRESDSLIDPVKECVWSLGICLFATAYGRVPYEGQTRADVLRNIMNTNLVLPDTRSNTLVGPIRGSLAIDPAVRFGIDEVKSHAFFF